jgi:hypothetical protein
MENIVILIYYKVYLIKQTIESTITMRQALCPETLNGGYGYYISDD